MDKLQKYILDISELEKITNSCNDTTNEIIKNLIFYLTSLPSFDKEDIKNFSHDDISEFIILSLADKKILKPRK